MTDNDREQELQRLAAENARWADAELHLLETIRKNQRRLEQLPDIIRRLEEEQDRLIEEHKHITAEMNRTGAEHDALEAEDEGGGAVYDAKFHAWANDMADAYADHLLAVQPPVGW